MLSKIFNTGTLQSILATVSMVSGGLDFVLTKLGCSASPTGTVVCLAGNAPSWLPPSTTTYLMILAGIAGALHLVIRFAKGTATTSSAPISLTGTVGTVHPDAVIK